MAQLILDIADNKVNFFLELIKKFDFIKVKEKSKYIELTVEQKDILEERIENYKNNPESYIDFDDVKSNIKKRYDI